MHVRVSEAVRLAGLPVIDVRLAQIIELVEDGHRELEDLARARKLRRSDEVAIVLLTNVDTEVLVLPVLGLRASKWASE